jgi:hypothetical protein
MLLQPMPRSPSWNAQLSPYLMQVREGERLLLLLATNESSSSSSSKSSSSSCSRQAC